MGLLNFFPIVYIVEKYFIICLLHDSQNHIFIKNIFGKIYRVLLKLVIKFGRHEMEIFPNLI